jgi:hypothetical protein
MHDAPAKIAVCAQDRDRGIESMSRFRQYLAATLCIQYVTRATSGLRPSLNELWKGLVLQVLQVRTALQEPVKSQQHLLSLLGPVSEGPQELHVLPHFGTECTSELGQRTKPLQLVSGIVAQQCTDDRRCKATAPLPQFRKRIARDDIMSLRPVEVAVDQPCPMDHEGQWPLQYALLKPGAYRVRRDLGILLREIPMEASEDASVDLVCVTTPRAYRLEELCDRIEG